MIKEFLLVGAGGALGSMLRYAGNILYQSQIISAYNISHQHHWQFCNWISDWI